MIPRQIRRFCFGLGFLMLAVAWVRADSTFTISSPAFQSGSHIPIEYGYHVHNLPPELHINNVPAKAQSLVLIVDDPDSPSGLWTHWLIWSLPATALVISADKLPTGAIQGVNSFGHARYDGPAPPWGTHRYYFRIYALDRSLSLPDGANRAALDAAMKGHIVGTAETMGTYSASSSL